MIHKTNYKDLIISVEQLNTHCSTKLETIYEVSAVPSLLYGSESWRLNPQMRFLRSVADYRIKKNKHRYWTRTKCMLITVATGSKAWNVFAHSISWIVGFNPTWWIDVCWHFFCLCCPVYVVALQWADLPSKESPTLYKIHNQGRRRTSYLLPMRKSKSIPIELFQTCVKNTD
jgi:hypothetical protein